MILERRNAVAGPRPPKRRLVNATRTENFHAGNAKKSRGEAETMTGLLHLPASFWRTACRVCSIVRVALPVRHGTGQPRTPRGRSIMRINALIVDDSKAMLRVMSALCNELNINRVDCCQTGEDALKLLDKHKDKYNLLFIDLNMPGMDGMELMKAVAQRRFKGGVAIVSALDERVIALAADVARQRQVHLVGCVSKPIDRDKIAVILEKLRLLLAHARAPDKPLSVDELRDSIRNRRLVPYFQPKVDGRSGAVHGFETLARILIPGSVDCIAPDRFIPVAEQNALMDVVTEEIFSGAFKQFVRILQDVSAHCRMALNLSPFMLNDPTTPDRLHHVASQHGVDPQQVIVEITEHLAVDTTVQMETLNRLRIKGFGLSLDDYGTGFTNIQQLKALPYTEIKIDRSLVHNIARDKLSQIIVKSLFDISQALKVDVVAEGIENADDLTYLKEAAAPVILQGYIISRPKPLDAVLRWCHGWQRVAH
jgi:EAL domain-containing protein (putative c-di-GMP-specific phosphodiesterase class I)/CheY-like chemotaxis protein